MHVYLVHGFNVRDGGRASVDVFAPLLEHAGMTVHSPDYGWIGLLGVRLFNDNLASILAGCLEPASGIIAHSNGADLVRRISFMDVPKFKAVLINPALDVDTKFGDALESALVLYNRKDWPVWFAQWLLFSPWGAMGRYGYLGNDRRITNLDCYPLARGHSGVFKRPGIWAPPIVTFMTDGSKNDQQNPRKNKDLRASEPPQNRT